MRVFSLAPKLFRFEIAGQAYNDGFERKSGRKNKQKFHFT